MVAPEVYSWPWKAPMLNIVDFVTCLALAILVVLTGLYVPEVTGDTLRAVQTCSMILLGIIFGVVGLMILCSTVLRSVASRIDTSELDANSLVVRFLFQSGDGDPEVAIQPRDS